jgi:hypothetical protein
MAVTPEAAGSSPVDPANYPSVNKRVPVLVGACLQTGRRPRSWLVCKTRRNRSSFHTHFALLRSHGLREILELSKRQGAGTPRPPAQIAGGRGTEKFDVDRARRRGWLAAQRHELTPGSEQSARDIGLPIGRSRRCFMLRRSAADWVGRIVDETVSWVGRRSPEQTGTVEFRDLAEP